MATTTNYGWTTPDDTALVKDGASAIRTLGSSVDTTVKALNPETTLGDISYRSSTANTKTRLGIGSTGQVLTVSGGVPTWATPTSGGAFTSLATGSLSGSTVSITSISQSYTDLYLVLDDISLNADAPIRIRFNNDTTGSKHLFNNLAGRVGAGFAGVFEANTYVDLTYYFADSVDNNSHYTLRAFDYTKSLKQTGIATASYFADNGNEATVLTGWTYAIASAITRIDIFTTSTFGGGTYTLYGVK